MGGRGIAVAGSILVDEINTVAKYPAEGELTQISSVSKSVGGCVPNVSVDLKKIMPGLKVTAIGKVGRDENGRYVKKVLESSGVDVAMIRESPERSTSFTQVISVSGGQRTFFTYSGASADFGAADVDLSGLDADVLHLGYFLLLDRIDGGDGIAVLRAAKEAGLKTSIDLVSENSDRYGAVLPCLPYTDYLIINELEAARLAGTEPTPDRTPETAKKLIGLGVKEKVIIHFPDGAVCASADGGLLSAGSFDLPPEYINGTTGAGDAFCAGALAAILMGLSDKEILECGTVCATLALGSQDATSGITDIGTAFEKCRAFKRKPALLV